MSTHCTHLKHLLKINQQPSVHDGYRDVANRAITTRPDKRDLPGWEVRSLWLPATLWCAVILESSAHAWLHDGQCKSAYACVHVSANTSSTLYEYLRVFVHVTATGRVATWRIRRRYFLKLLFKPKCYVICSILVHMSRKSLHSVARAVLWHF